MEFLTKNFKWIALVVIVLVLTNVLTGIKVDSLSKKDRKKVKARYDSLETRYKQLDFVHLTELANRRKIFLKDSVDKANYLLQIEKDKKLIAAQERAIAKYKLLPSKINLAKLDSAYEAENP